MKHVKGRLDESILVCVYYGLNGERLIRRGHKMATMLDCPLYILSVDSQPLDAFDAEKSSYIEQWKKLSDELEVEKFILQDNEKTPHTKKLLQRSQRIIVFRKLSLGKAHKAVGRKSPKVRS